MTPFRCFNYGVGMLHDRGEKSRSRDYGGTGLGCPSASTLLRPTGGKYGPQAPPARVAPFISLSLLQILPGNSTALGPLACAKGPSFFA